MIQGDESSGHNPESRDELRISLRGSVKALGDLGFGSELQREILRRLIDGRRTITELVELIYGTSRSNEGFKADFMKVSRAVRRLENRGLIATNILGREKPYRLTTHALETLYHLGGPDQARGLASHKDMAVYVATLVSGGAALALAWGSPSLPAPGWIFLPSSIFMVLLGVSICRMSSMMRRIL